ncbi:MAG: MoaD/ThiS family protein [Acidimicrobiales bacterium]
MSRLLLLGPARNAAGVRHDEIDGDTVGAVVAVAVARYGPAFADVVAVSALWVNGARADADQAVGPDDEVAVLPPISGG